MTTRETTSATRTTSGQKTNIANSAVMKPEMGTLEMYVVLMIPPLPGTMTTRGMTTQGMTTRETTVIGRTDSPSPTTGTAPARAATPRRSNHGTTVSTVLQKATNLRIRMTLAAQSTGRSCGSRGPL